MSNLAKDTNLLCKDSNIKIINNILKKYTYVFNYNVPDWLFPYVSDRYYLFNKFTFLDLRFISYENAMWTTESEMWATINAILASRNVMWATISAM